MLRALDDPPDTRRLAIIVSDDAYDVLNRARIAAAASAGRPAQRMAEFVGDLVEALAQGLDPVEIERRIGEGRARLALETGGEADPA